MDPFLKAVASDLYSTLGDQIQQVTLVYPNRRASLFFNKYLAQILHKPLWQPQTTTVSDLMYSLAKVKPADPLLLCYMLYKQYLTTTHKNESFDDFYFWGNVMLADFDQVDKYLVDAKKLFANILDIKQIDRRFDDFDTEQRQVLEKFLNTLTAEGQSTIRTLYSQIWDQLGPIYQAFTQQLVAQQLAYDGLAYRLAAEVLQNAREAQFHGVYALVGFNALNSCEKVLFNHLKTFCNARFYWDYDQYYLSDVKARNEAAMFMVDNLQQFPNSLGSEHFNNFHNKQINLIEAPSNVAQAKIVPHILKDFGQAPAAIGLNSAIILPDEQLLLPVLSALPKDLQQVNITMAYPIQQTAAYSLVDFLFGLRINVRIEGHKYYFKDVLNILGHPYVAQLSPNVQAFAQEITEKKLISIDPQLFTNDKFLCKIFPPSNKVPLVQYLIDVVLLVAAALSARNSSQIADNEDDSKITPSTLAANAELNPKINLFDNFDKNILSGNNVDNNYLTVNSLSNNILGDIDGQTKLELEFLYAMYKALNRLNSVLPVMGDDVSKVRTVRALFRKAMHEQRVSFIGEPLSGLQVMGFLETRNLDFDNLIILSMDDATLPGPDRSPSFILPSLRMAYGLPDYRHQNAMFAYYFYRCIQRASNVNLVYAAGGESKANERSRYILQLIHESPLQINYLQWKFKIGQRPEPQLVVKKTPQVMQILQQYVAVDQHEMGKILAPTKLAVYKNCKIKFFFSQIAGFAAPNEVDEAVDERTTGTILHRAIELIYSKLYEQQITTEHVKKLLSDKKNIEYCVNVAFAQSCGCSLEQLPDLMNGRNRLTWERVRWMLERMLHTDLKRTPYAIFSHEQKFSCIFPIEVDGNVMRIRIGGYPDRIERTGNIFRIVDFKSGRYKKENSTFEQIQDLYANPSLDGVFQLFVYSEIVSRLQLAKPEQIMQNLWFVRSDALPSVWQKNADTTNDKNPNENNEKVHELQSYSVVQQDFNQMLNDLLCELFDPNVDFEQTTVKANCQFCDYREICGRNE